MNEESRTRFIQIAGSFIKALVAIGWGTMLIFSLFFLYNLDWNVYLKVVLALWFIELGVRRIYKILSVTTADLDKQLTNRNL